MLMKGRCLCISALCRHRRGARHTHGIHPILCRPVAGIIIALGAFATRHSPVTTCRSEGQGIKAVRDLTRFACRLPDRLPSGNMSATAFPQQPLAHACKVVPTPPSALRAAEQHDENATSEGTQVPQNLLLSKVLILILIAFPLLLFLFILLPSAADRGIFNHEKKPGLEEATGGTERRGELSFQVSPLRRPAGPNGGIH